MSREDLRIIRNQFYAVYGRKFQSADLTEYYEAEPWYRGNTEAGQFDEAILGGLIKRNIAFLNDAEEKYDAGQAAMAKKNTMPWSLRHTLNCFPSMARLR